MSVAPQRAAAQPAEGRRPRRGLTLSRAALVFGSMFVALGIVEASLRFFGQGKPVPWPIRCKRPELYEAFEPYGYRLHPGRSMTYLYPTTNPRTLTVVSNRDGFRSSREFDEPDSRTRIAVLGDSFVFGEGVEQAERFTELVEASTPQWRVDNLGMPGFGADLMLRAFERVSLPTHPDAVVLCMYTDDFHRVEPEFTCAGFAVPRFRIEDGALVSMPYPEPGVWHGLRLVNVVRRFAWSARHFEMRINQAVFDRLRSLGESHGFTIGIVFLPGTGDTKADKERRGWLAEYADDRRIPFVDLTDAVHTAGKSVFIPDNPHLNPVGHAVVAERLKSFLESRVLRPK